MKHAASLCKSISAILVNFMRTNTHNPSRMFDRLILLKRVIVAQPEILNVYCRSFLIATIVKRIMVGFQQGVMFWPLATTGAVSPTSVIMDLLHC